MKRNELIKQLIADGWYIHREGREHTLFRHPVKTKLVAVSRSTHDLATGTVERIKRDAGLP